VAAGMAEAMAGAAVIAAATAADTITEIGGEDPGPGSEADYASR
jgi:hypothetical protein